MFVTALLNDGSTGDTATYESGGASAASTGSCGFLTPTGYFTAQVRLGTVYSLTGLSYALRLTHALSGSGTPCTESFTSSSSAGLKVEAYQSGAWVEIYSGSLTAPSIPVSIGDSYYVDLTGTPTWSAALSCDIRMIVQFDASIWSITQSGTTHSVGIRVSDLRITGTDTAAACSGSSGSGGDESGGGGGDTGCGCSWNRGGACSGTWQEAESVTDPARHWEDGQELFPFTPRGEF